MKYPVNSILKPVGRMASLMLAGSLILGLAAGCAKEEKKVSNRGELTILSQPSEAAVFMLGKERGVTPKQVSNLPKGTYIIRLSKPNYQTTWEKVEIEPNSKKTLEAVLKPVTASVLLVSNPSGASVEFQGNEIGTTPLTIQNIPLGEYNAIMKMPGFSQIEVSWKVENERPVYVKGALLSNKGTLLVASEPANASVFLDGNPRGNTPFADEIPQGDHKLRVEKDGFTPYEAVVTVNRDKRTEITATLQMLPSSLSVTSNPSGAMVFVNDKPYSKTPFKMDHLQPGVYQVRVQLDGCDPATREVSVTPGRHFDVELTLDSNTGGIDLIAHPAGLTVYLDGKIVGTTAPDPAQKGLSKVFQLRSVSMGKHTVQVAHKRSRPQTRTISLNIEKGKIIRLPVLHMWIPNVILNMKNGKQYTGRIVNTADDAPEVMFEPEPGIKMTYKRSAIAEIIPLKDNES